MVAACSLRRRAGPPSEGGGASGPARQIPARVRLCAGRLSRPSRAVGFRRNDSSRSVKAAAVDQGGGGGRGVF